MQSYLFIGGSQDGISIALADVPESTRAPAGVTEKETYIRETLSVCEAAAIIYRHEDLTPEEVLSRLIESYKALNKPGG